MIIDAENTFFYEQDLSKGTKSTVVNNGEGGNAYNPLWLKVIALKPLSAAAAITLKTADKEDMTGAVTLTTLSLAKDEGAGAAVKVPAGCKKFLQIEVAGATTGTIRAFLTMDVDLV